LHLIPPPFFLSASHFSIFEVLQNAFAGNSVVLQFHCAVLPEVLNVREGLYIQQTETVSVNPVVGVCYDLEWVL
jgi:hypothetical protein